MDWIQDIFENIFFHLLELGLFALVFFLLKKNIDGKSSAINTEEGYKLVVGNYNKYAVYLSCLLPFIGIIGLFSIPMDAPNKFSEIIFFGIMTFGFGLFPLGGYWYGRNHWAIYNDEYIKISNWRGKITTMYWQNIANVVYEEHRMEYLFTDTTGKKMRLSRFMNGFMPQFYDFLKQKFPNIE